MKPIDEMTLAEKMDELRAALREVMEAETGIRKRAHWHSVEEHQTAFKKFNAAIANAARLLGGEGEK